MPDPSEPLPMLQGLHISDYSIRTLDDEIRVDKLCIDLLRHLCKDLNVRAEMSATWAGTIARGADHFLREFIVGACRENLFAVRADHVRRFAGHWYIIRTPEPSIEDLHHILDGTAEFYRFLARQGLLAIDAAEAIVAACGELAYYRQRIEDFWAIEGDGYEAWRQACPLEPATDQS